MEVEFEKLEEIIKDDDKIATVASFALETQKTLAESKEIFDKYVEIHKGSEDVNITHILNGRRKGERKLSILMVKDDDFEDEKKCYEVGVEHLIFSIQKVKNIDYNIITLVGTNNSDIKKPISGIVVGKKCTKRVLHKKVLPTIPTAVVKGKSTLFAKQNSVTKVDKVKVEGGEGATQESNKTKANNQGKIAGLFNKAAQNKKTDQKDIKQTEKKTNLSNFFTKQNVKETVINKQCVEIKEEKPDKIISNTQQKKSVTTDKNQTKKSDLFDSDTDEEILKDIEMVDKTIKTENVQDKKQIKNTRTEGKRNQKKKRGKSDVGNEKSAKKRKRIIVDDSESDDIFGSDKSDCEGIVEKSDEEDEPVKIAKKPLAPKNRKRKAVDKIYEDEDGYIVTKTEYVYESPSEDENEPKEKKTSGEIKAASKTEKKTTSENEISQNKAEKPKKNGNKHVPAVNQPTLMSFFKKK